MTQQQEEHHAAFACHLQKLLKLFTTGKKLGIYFIMFSRYSENGLIIDQKVKDLITIVHRRDSLTLGKIFGYILTDSNHDNHYSPEHMNNISLIDKMGGLEFEGFCRSLLSRNGFSSIVITKSSRDYGADLTAEKDDIKYVIQCKRYYGNVGEEAVREVYSSKKMYHAEVAVVLTNSYFTKAAQVLAKHNFVHLWDRDRLIEMMR